MTDKDIMNFLTHKDFGQDNWSMKIKKPISFFELSFVIEQLSKVELVVLANVSLVCCNS